MMNDHLNIGLLYSGIIYYNKINSSLTLSANSTLIKNLNASLSYSYINKSMNNLGVGVAVGRSPAQFYIITDNILGFFWPLSARNINLRFGLNLIFGCNEKMKVKGPECFWIKSAEKRRDRMKRLLHK